MSALKLTPKVDLRSPIYHDDDPARAHLESVLWPQGPHCPHCGVMGDRIHLMQGKSTRPGLYKCKDCRKPFTVTVKTVMERSHIPLSKWVLAAQIMASSKKGFSALQLQRMIGTNYETAWFMFHRLRECTSKSGRHRPNSPRAQHQARRPIASARRAVSAMRGQRPLFGAPWKASI
jgi:transposase-like protein